MKIQIGRFPVEIDEEKIPVLLDKALPQATRLINQAKEWGIDVTPILQSFFPQAKAHASPASSLPPEGSVLDHTGAIVSLSAITGAIKNALEKQNVPVPRSCSSCSSRNAATGTFNVASQNCLSCYSVPGLPNFKA